VTETKRTIVADPLSKVQPKRARFAWDRRVPLGAPTLFAGTGGIGKSTILAWVVAGLSRGSLPGDLEGTPATVAIVAGEDDTETTLVPRLQAAGADLDRVWLVNAHATDGKEQWREHPTIAGHLQELKKALTELGARVLVVDPVVSMQSGNSKDLSDVRRDLDKFAALAKELDMALIWVHHFNKGQGHASDRMSGSHAYRDIPRSVLLLAQDEDSGERILSHDKSNYGELQPSLAFTIATAEVPVADGEVSHVGRAQCLGESELNVQDIVGREERSLGANRIAILELADARDVITPKDVAELLDTSPASARTYLGRLKKSRDLESDKPGQFRITDIGRVAVSRVAVSRDNVTAQQAQQGLNITPLFPDYDDDKMETN
jgi:hypothetical protein